MRAAKTARTLKSLEARLLDRQRAYYHLAIQVSVATGVLVVYAAQRLNDLNAASLSFLALLFAGHLPNLFAAPRFLKQAGSVLAIIGGAASVFVDPTTTTAQIMIGLGIGVVPGVV